MNVSDGQAVGDPAEKNGEKPQNKRRSGRVVYPVIVVLLLAFLIVPRVMSKYDEGHHVQIECTVTEAKGKEVSGSRNGGGPHQRVFISTSECGKLVFETGITASNRDAVAAELVPGERYSFEIGKVADTFRWLTGLLGQAPEVWSFEETNG